jgi:hypothetical protein
MTTSNKLRAVLSLQPPDQQRYTATWVTRPHVSYATGVVACWATDAEQAVQRLRKKVAKKTGLSTSALLITGVRRAS